MGIGTLLILYTGGCKDLEVSSYTKPRLLLYPVLPIQVETIVINQDLCLIPCLSLLEEKGVGEKGNSGQLQ